MRAVLLEVRGLSAQFEGITLFSGIDVALEPGDILRVESETELARTALLECIAGITAPATGSISVDGAVLVSGVALDQGGPNRVVSVLHDEGFPQDEPVVVHLRRALAADATEPDAAAARLLERVRLTHRADHEPWAMSAGEYRRIALELAFSVRKKVLVLDEPERRLDRPGIDWLLESLRRQAADGVAVVLATYDDRLGDLASRRLELVNPAEI